MALTQRGINIPVTGQFQDGDDIVDALRAQGLSVDSALGSAIGPLKAQVQALLDAVTGPGAIDATDPAVTALLTDTGSGAYAATIAIVEDAADGAVAAAIDNDSSETRAALTHSGNKPVGRGEIIINPMDYGAVGDAATGGSGTDDTAALQAALAAAQNTTFIPATVTRRLHLPALFKCSEDLVINTSNVEITGEGDRSGLLFLDAGLVIDGTSGLLLGNALRDLRVKRLNISDGGGVAVDIVGGASGSGNYVTRWKLDHVHLEAADGIALRLRGTFLGTAVGVYLRNSDTGLVIDNDPDAGTLSANSVSFHGGEIQAVNKIGYVVNALGISFHGMAWEGSDEGMDVDDTQGFSVFGPYWERNGQFDLRVGHTTGCAGVTVHGGFASTGALGVSKLHSIVLERSLGTDIRGMYFSSFGDSPVLINEASNGAVVGQATNCRNSAGGTPVVKVQAGTLWTTMTLGEPSQAGTLRMNGPASTLRTVEYRTLDSLRWRMGADATAEGGSNAGTNWQLLAYSDTGTLLGTALSVLRATQTFRVHGPLYHMGSTAGFFGKTPVARPTGVPVTAEGIHAALVALGLIEA